MEIGTKLGGLELEHPIMNAAGTCKTYEHAERFARSAVSAVVVGPITPLPREVRDGNVYWESNGYSLNSLGMPNPGVDYFLGYHLPRIREAAQEYEKPLILQIAGFSPDDYVFLASRMSESDFRLIELNLGCPNVWDGGHQHGILSFDPEAIEKTVLATAQECDLQLGLKLSPYSDPALLERVAETINQLNQKVGLGYVALSNTFPNAMVLDENGRPVITAGSGLAGLSGKAMKPISLGQVYQFASHLESVDIVGVGGITTGRDVIDYRRAGAKAVQASTIYWNNNEDPGAYSDLLSSYVDALDSFDDDLVSEEEHSNSS